MFIIFSLLFFLFLKVCTVLNYCKLSTVPGVFYGIWNSPSVTLFSNKHDCIFNEDKQQQATLFSMQKETGYLKLIK